MHEELFIDRVLKSIKRKISTEDEIDLIDKTCGHVRNIIGFANSCNIRQAVDHSFVALEDIEKLREMESSVTDYDITSFKRAVSGELATRLQKCGLKFTE